MDSNHESGKSQENASSKGQGGDRKPKNIKKIIIITILGILILFSLTLKATSYIDNPQFCKQCHAMDYYYNTWVESTHSSISCYSCHLGSTPIKKVTPMPMTNKRYWTLSLGNTTINVSNFMNKVKEVFLAVNRTVDRVKGQINFASARLQDLKKFFSFASTTTGSNDIAPMWGNCLTCHKDLVSSSKTDHVGHQTHIKKGMTCDQCHQTVVHGKEVTMGRSGCVDCHKTPMPKPPSHKTAAFQTGHGKDYVTRKNCTICHVNGSKEKICMDCHGMQVPHPKNFASIHIQSIKPVGVQTCMKCHQDSDNKGTQKRDSIVTCSKCHGKGTPHKRSGKTISSHPQLVKQKGVSSCMNCHNAEQDCTSCHGLEMPHPKGFVKQHTQLIKNVGQDLCIKCHDKARGKDKLCLDCHGMEMPHPYYWRGGHAYSKEGKPHDTSKCAKCHSPKNPVNPKAPWAAADFCNSCHGRVRPHDMSNHAELTAYYDCNTCHVQDYCVKCHGEGGY